MSVIKKIHDLTTLFPSLFVTKEEEESTDYEYFLNITSEKPQEGMSSDFDNFLNGLGSMVYKYKKATRAGSDRQRRDEYSYTTSAAAALPTLISMRDEAIFKTQQAALRDVLMMKLVSYYENKYQITDHVSTTTDISVLRENNMKSVDALNEIKRTQHTPINLKSREENKYEEEVLVI